MDLKKFLDKLKDQLDTLRYQIEDIGDKIKSNKKVLSISLKNRFSNCGTHLNKSTRG